MDHLKNIRNNLYNRLENTGWQEKLSLLVKSSDFDDILSTLYNEVQDDRRFTPPIKDLFKPFELCKFQDLKVIFVYPEPYPDPTLNDGLAISHTQNVGTELGFFAMINGLIETVGSSSVTTGDLSSWAKQGVLLLNTTFTTMVMNPGQHNEIWKPFTNYLFEVLNKEKDLIWVWFGTSKYHPIINNPTHVKLYASALPTERNIKWNGQIVFKQINNILVDKQKDQIVW